MSPQTMTLTPLFDRIVVKELEPPHMRRSGLMIPMDATRDRIPPQEAIVLAVGPGMDWWAQHGIEMPVSVGDHIVFPSSAGTYVEVDEERLLVMPVGQVLGVLA